MIDGFTVDPDQLDAHADRVGAYAGHLRDAARAARPLDTGAFGLIGQVFAIGAAASAQRSSAAVASLSDTADEHAADLAGCLADYLLVERRVAASFGAGS